MEIFTSQPGSVVAVATSYALPVRFYLQGFAGALAFKAILTNVEITAQSGVSFMHSMRDFIYVYTFNERISPIAVSGIAFDYFCNRPGDTLGNVGGHTLYNPFHYHGLEYVMAYYDAYRVTRTGTPLLMIVGLTTIYRVFLTGVSSLKLSAGEESSPTSNLATFTFQLAALPLRDSLLATEIAEALEEEEEEEGGGGAVV